MANLQTTDKNYINLAPLTALFHALVAFFVLTLFIFNVDIANKTALAVILMFIVISGLAYNFLLVGWVASKSGLLSKYFQLLFIVIELVVIVYFTGGLNSAWYNVFLMLIIGCSVLGLGAFYINIGIVTAFYIVMIVVKLISSTATEFNFSSFPATISALVFAGMVAYASDNYRRTTELTEQISSQLDHAKLTERLMLAAIADPVIGIDSDRNIILMNEAAQTLSGWDMHDALDLPYSQVFRLRDSKDRDVTNDTDPFVHVLKDQKPTKTDNFYLLRKNNQKISVLMSIAPTVNSEGRVSGAIAVITDISEEKALQRERNEFVSTASHEMRTPVAAIEGYLSMAFNPSLATIDERAKGFLIKAHDSSIHLGALFQDLLSVTKIEDKHIKDSRKVFNLSDLVLKISSEMESIASKKNLSLKTHIGGAGIKNELVVAPTFMVSADPLRLNEIVTNLVDNAIKYTQAGGVDINITGDKSSVSVEITDTGMGITPQEQKHLFEKFYRVDNTMTREQSGTGLGLYIARNLVELYGGKIWVSSKLGKGSTFGFRLPIVRVVA